jgi:glycosyltransferase involved in cell wall biosynthesis
VKIKLGYICGTQSWGGLEMNQFRNALWMKERGHSVVMFFQKNSPVENACLENGIDVITIQKHKKYFDFKNGKILAKLITKNKVTHLIVRATYDMSLTAIAKRKLGEKLHLSYFMEMQLGVKKTNFLHTLRYRNFDLWSCPLPWLAEQTRTMTRFPHDRIVVIPSGLDLSQFSSPMDRTEARKIMELPEQGLMFGLIGRFDPHKGQVLLLEAMHLCKSKDFSVVLLGEPTKNEGTAYYDEMLKLIEEGQLEDRVFVRPFRKDTEPFYKAIDWFVMASRAETFGMVTIEAMACGTPTLGSNAGGTPEILDQGKYGVLFEPMNATDLALKIDQIIEEKISIDPLLLKEGVKLYDHNAVSEQLERTLGLMGHN